MSDSLKIYREFLIITFTSVSFCQILRFLEGRRKSVKKGLMSVEAFWMEGREKGFEGQGMKPVF